jgi:hypothetical protein
MLYALRLTGGAMKLPFSHAEFFDVFAAYNSALWPLAAALWMLSLAVFVQVVRGKQNDRAVTALLAVHWGWTGLAYHWAYFTVINPAALAFATGFLVQALLLVTASWRGSIRYSRSRAPRHVIGAAMVVYSLSYPALAAMATGSYPRIPTFGVPCPTTLFTIGLLLMAIRIRLSLLIIPWLWAVIGGSAAVLFGVIPDFALIAAAVLVLLLRIAPRRFERPAA